MRKLWLVLTVAMYAITTAVGTGSAQARLDPSFGQGGVVEVRPPLPAPWRDQYIRHMAAARGGDSFVLFERQYCGWSCFGSNALFRYLSDGSLDPAFGGATGSYELPQEGEGIPALAVDSAGRPLLAQASANSVVVRRLTPLGAPDTTFGTDGSVEVDCRCEYGAQLAPGPRGTVTVVVPRGRYGIEHGYHSRTGTIFTLVRLNSDGIKDRRFGQGGATTFGLRGAESFVSSATTKDGALYFGGAGCCGSEIAAYVVRVSAGGRLDQHFTTASQRSLRSIRRLTSLTGSVNAIVIKRGGKIDLLGSVGYEKGFVLRLNPNGRPHRKFGKKGLRALPLPVASAVLGGDGATLAVSDEGLGGFGALMRIFPGGRLDPAFGPRGERVPKSRGDSGMSVVAQTGRGALVLDLGMKECRGYCPPDPKLIRFLENSPTRR